MAQNADWMQRMWPVKEEKQGEAGGNPKGQGRREWLQLLQGTSVQGGSIAHISQGCLWAGATQPGKNIEAFWCITCGQDRAWNLHIFQVRSIKTCTAPARNCQPHCCCFFPPRGQLCTSASHQEKQYKYSLSLALNLKVQSQMPTKPHHVSLNTPVLCQTHPHSLLEIPSEVTGKILPWCHKFSCSLLSRE